LFWFLIVVSGSVGGWFGALSLLLKATFYVVKSGVCHSVALMGLREEQF